MSENLSIEDARFCRVAVKFYIHILEDCTPADIQKVLGISQPQTSRLLKGDRSGSRQQWEAIAERLGHTLDSFIKFGRSKLEDRPTIEPESQDEWEHFKVVRRFKNKGIALEMNRKLQEYESRNQWRFIKLLNKIDVFINEIESDDEREAGREAVRSGIKG